MRYRKKPIEIDAVQIWKGLVQKPHMMPNWLADAMLTGRWYPSTSGANEEEKSFFIVKTEEGKMRGEWGDWIVRGVEGELYPCRDSVFQATYEEVR